MHLEIDPSSPVPLYAQILEEVRLAIATGVLRPGDRLPPIRDLAARIAVNPLTVVKAYTILVGEGVLEAKQGTGTFVAKAVGGRQEPPRRERARMARKWADELAARALRLGIPKEEALEMLARAFDDLDGGGTGRKGGR
jgi:GntR family transcriptional regulator